MSPANAYLYLTPLHQHYILLCLPMFDANLLQDFRNFSCPLRQGCQDHGHGPHQEAGRHRRHVHPFPHHPHSDGAPKRLKITLRVYYEKEGSYFENGF